MAAIVTEGGTYYFITHAYHHFIATVKAMQGPQRAEVVKVVKIHSCSRGWEDFFNDGAEHDTTCFKFPNGEITWCAVFEWKHPTPRY